MTPGASAQVVPAGDAPRFTLVSYSNSRHHGFDAKDVEGPAEIVGERGEAELGPDIVEALHQKGALVHPLLDAAEGMLDDLAAPVRIPAFSARTKAALQAAKARGVKLGGLRHRVDGSVVKLDAATIAAGRAARTAHSAARASDLAPIIANIKATGANSLREIAAALNGRGIPTARGGEWSAVQVQRVMNRVGM